MMTVVYFKVPSHDVPGGTSKNRDKPQSGEQALGPRIKPGTSCVRRKIPNHYTLTIGMTTFRCLGGSWYIVWSSFFVCRFGFSNVL